jgi:hypothetical protein
MLDVRARKGDSGILLHAKEGSGSQVGIMQFIAGIDTGRLHLGIDSEIMSEEISTVRNGDTIDISEEESELIPSEGYIVDYITGEKLVKDTPKEQVRQFIAKALEQEYNIALEDMQADFVVGSGKSPRVIDIAVFHHQRDHTLLNLSRAVICRPIPCIGYLVHLLSKLTTWSITTPIFVVM